MKTLWHKGWRDFWVITSEAIPIKNWIAVWLFHGGTEASGSSLCERAGVLGKFYSSAEATPFFTLGWGVDLLWIVLGMLRTIIKTAQVRAVQSCPC